MDYGLLNAIGITVMAAFGLWIFQYALKKYGAIQKKNDKDRRND